MANAEYGFRRVPTIREFWLGRTTRLPYWVALGGPVCAVDKPREDLRTYGRGAGYGALGGEYLLRVRLTPHRS